MEPKALCLSVMFSLVCESKAGFSMRQLTKTLRCAWPRPKDNRGGREQRRVQRQGERAADGGCGGGGGGGESARLDVRGLEGLLEPLVLLLEVL